MIVAGAGMAGLVTAVRARELGLAPVVCEKGTRPGGSMLLSSGVVWRHAEWEAFRREFSRLRLLLKLQKVIQRPLRQ